MSRISNEHGYTFNVPGDCYMAFGLPINVINASTEILTFIFYASTANVPFF